MILIVSKNSEHTTCLVMDWLHFNNAACQRINGVDSFYKLSYELENGKSVENDTDKYSVVWFRRWLEKEYNYINSEITSSPAVNRHACEYLRAEGNEIRNYFLAQLKPRHLLGNVEKATINKLKTLQAAKEAGFTVPATLVTSSRSVLKDFINRHGSVIVKNIGDPTYLTFRKKYYATYTATIENDNVDRLPESFFPSLIQQQIQKKYELRIFYLDTQCYAMAIFSQSNSKTAVDFRKYDYANPNRNVPYALPDDVKKAASVLMKLLELNCGSIDLIKGTDDKYYFLEVNPQGQFGMVSEPCNYHLEEKVAEWLTKKMEYEN